MGSGPIVALVKYLPRGVLDLAYRYRYSFPFRSLRPVLERRLTDAKEGREIVRGPLTGQKIAFDAVDSKIIWMGLHEPLVQDCIIEELRPGEVAYDIGAHIGYFVLLMAKAVGATGKVVAFEPDPSTHRFLAKTVELNDLKDKVMLLSVALGDRLGKGQIVRGWQSGYTQVQPEGDGDISMSTLDEQVFGVGLPPPSLILIDTEGAEETILRGANRVLAEYHPKMLLEHHSMRQSLVELLAPYGYVASDIDESHTLFK